MNAPATITLDRPESDIAVLTLDNPEKSANILSRSVLQELSDHLDALESDRNLAGLIIRSAKPGMFIAGADLREFVESFDADDADTVAMCRQGQQLFGRLSSGPWVSVVAIEGICVGGGAELAVWCDRRLMARTDRTQIGFPEVKIGLYPGWGGTARTPRLIGLANAVQLITSGESISAEEAYRQGLANDLADADDLLPAAIRLVREEQQTQAYLRDREQQRGPVPVDETELGFLGVTGSGYIQGQTKGHYPAPLAALETMLETISMDVDAACVAEAEGMAALFGSPVNRALVNVFFLTDRNKKDRGVEGAVEPSKISRVGVIGAGIMGAGIAAANIKRGVPVRLTDASEDALQRGAGLVLEEISFDRETRSANAQKLLERAPLLQALTPTQFGEQDLVIEAVVENADVKKQLFARLEQEIPPETILASNTSTIPITSLAADLEHPQRFCGIHFFNPVRRMKLVEVIRGERTSEATVATAVAYAKRLGKMPIVLNDGPGFLVNRLLFPYMNEALQLLGEGAEIAAIERAAKSFGMPMGPIELYDMVGLDTALYAGRVMWEAFPDRIVASPLLPAMVKRGWLGAKSGSGFFQHGKKKRGPLPVNPELPELMREYVKPTQSFDRETIQWRLFLPMLLEATRTLQEGIVRDPRDVDLGLIFGIGFPPFKGGLLFWADSIGASQLLEKLKSLESLGTRMQPTPLLEEMAADNKTFYER